MERCASPVINTLTPATQSPIDIDKQNPLQYNLQQYSHSHYPNLVDPPAPRVINSSNAIHDKPKHDDEQRDILNLDYAKQASINANKSALNNKLSDSSHIDPINKIQPSHGYDHMFESSIGFNKNFDISSTKAIEMFNRAATMSFSKSKTFPSPLAETMSFSKSFPTSLPNQIGKNDNANDLTNLSKCSPSGLLNTYQLPSTVHTNYSIYSLDNKSTHLSYNPHDIDSSQAASVQQSNQKQQQQHPNLYDAERLDQPMSSIAPTLPNDNRLKSNELNISSIPSHRYDVSSYDPNMRNIIHPIVDDNINGSNCYYPPKDLNAPQNLYANKNVLPQSQTSPVSSLPQSQANPYNISCR